MKAAGAQFLRGGAYKPRTSPYSFQGLEEQGLKYLAEARERTGLRVVTEVTTVEAVDRVAAYADMLQVGARNMQNFGLLKAVGKAGKPVLLKRGLAATLNEWLNAAEYIMNEGNPNVVFCERGIRTYETYTRNTLDLSAVAAIQHLSHRGRCGRPHDRDAPESGEGALGRPAVADAGTFPPRHGRRDKAFAVHESGRHHADGSLTGFIEKYFLPARFFCKKDKQEGKKSDKIRL